ncbi:hypothetical protein GVX82_00475 [Patescibacteria group bacterium]|jgi:cytoskeletal protein CcmA (bactofilin family)|nr:hypothetical protein [Patescibacteria group bacterium]
MRTNHLLALPLLLVLPLVALAATFHVRESVTIDSYVPGSGNTYAVGEKVSVAADVGADLTTFGAQVAVSGAVAEDLLAFGSDLALSGDVAGDVRALAVATELSSSITGDLILATGKLRSASSTVVAGDARLAAESIVLDGVWERDIALAGNEVTLAGEFRGTVVARVGQSLTVAPSARIAGDLVYRAPEEAAVPAGVVASGSAVSFTKQAPVISDTVIERIVGAFAFLATGALLVGYLLASVLLVAVFPGFAGRVVRFVLRKPAAAIGFGVLGWLGLLVGGLVALLTVVLFWVALGAWVLLAGLHLLATLLMAALAGGLLSRWLVKRTVVSWPWTLLGGIVTLMLDLVFLIGPITNLLLFLAVFGSVLRGCWEYWWKGRTTGTLNGQ